MDGAAKYAIAAVVVAVILIGAIYLLTTSGTNNALNYNTTSVPYNANGPTTTASQTTTSGQKASTPIAMTDPPHVPAGTQAVVIAYSSLMVHQSGVAGSGWVNSNSSGSIDLMSVTNSSKVIGYANLSSNATIDMARFNITSATVKINGTTYNAAVPSNSVTVHITAGQKLNSSSVVLVDMSPTVSAVYNNNATTFILVPSAKGAVVTSAGASVQVGSAGLLSINANINAQLNAAAPNLSITSASVSTSSSNNTNITLTVKDNSNSPVTIGSVLLVGPQKAFVSPGASVNASTSASINAMINGNGASANANANSKAAAKTAEDIEAFQATVFAVGSNGHLSIASNAGNFTSSSGVTIQPGSTATLSFNGKMAYDSGVIQGTTVSGSQYWLTAQGSGGSSATTHVTGS